VPEARTIAMLFNPNTRNSGSAITSVKEAAAVMGLKLDILEARSDRDYAPAVAKLIDLRAGA
jgi:ABC-type uncharacterized transport system substrate-binding protein